MFHADRRAARWATAFINVLGKDAGAQLEYLKALRPALKPVLRDLSGLSAAKQLEKVLRGHSGPESEMTIRFVSLMVSKNRFGSIDSIIAGIEQKLDEQKGILNLTVETAAAADSTLKSELEKMICEQTGAAGINMKLKVVPELIAGYRLRIAGLCIDASLRGQLNTMTKLLSGSPAAAGAAF